MLGVFVSLVAWPLAAQTPTTGQTPTTQTTAQTPTTTQTPQPEQNPANPTPLSDLATLQRGTAPTEITPAARPQRPYRGLFGTPTKNLEPRLTFEGTVGGGTGGNPAQDQAGGGPSGGGSAAGGGSGAGTGSATVTYSWTRQKMGVNANNVYFVDYYPNATQNSFLPRDVLSGAFYFVPKPALRVTISPNWKNLPELSLSDLQGTELAQVVPQQHDVGLTVDRYKRFGTDVDIGLKLSERARIDGSVNYGHGMIAQRQWTILLYSGNFSYNITRGLAAYVGYQFGGQVYTATAADGTTAQTEENRPRLDFGLDFTRPLSLTRRTTLLLSTGVEGVEDRVERHTTYRAVGGARLNREIGRSWIVGVFAGRNVRYVEAYSQPLFSDSAGVMANGMLNRRMEFTSTFGVSTGTQGASVQGFDNYYGSANLSIGLTRSLALGVDYWYSKLTAPPGSLPIDFTGKTTQNSIHGYVKVWAPLISRPKKF